MTRDTRAIDLIMVHGNHWRPSATRMTGFTDIRGVDMAARQVMARSTSTVHLRMIHRYHRDPTGSPMTGLAHVGAVDVSARQAMAAGTGAGAVDL